jgi:hypothetical protein
VIAALEGTWFVNKWWAPCAVWYVARPDNLVYTREQRVAQNEVWLVRFVTLQKKVRRRKREMKKRRRRSRV